eukprot:GFYU01006064.1.p1 GENE.GFYU01006064.1~~GFYU01006064.1.p1  ORF type:complete len:288 (-),score=65.29 GFYU01006064.1:321-1184(-)
MTSFAKTTGRHGASGATPQSALPRTSSSRSVTGKDGPSAKPASGMTRRSSSQAMSSAAAKPGLARSTSSGAMGSSTDVKPKPLARKPSWGSGGFAASRIDQNVASNPFKASSKSKTNFSQAYQAGNIPARINHGSVKSTLKWDTAPEEMYTYDPLLVLCCEGLAETQHPYVFVSRTALKELLAADVDGEKTIPLLPKVIPVLRHTFAVNKTDDVFKATLEAIRNLSAAVGPALNEYLSLLLVQISKKAFDKAHRDNVTETLQQLEENGGDEALTTIKSKVPTYTSIF